MTASPKQADIHDSAPTDVHTDVQIDVLIPVYNGARWLEEAVHSIQQQSHRALRIHVVDDGSSDATPQLLAQLAAGDTRLMVHTQPNGGIVSALNHGLRFCTAAYVARHDADDVAHPSRLATQLQYLQAHPDCVAVGAIACHIDAHGQPLGTHTELRPTSQADATWCPAREPYLMHPLLLARRQALLDVGGYRPVVHAEDSDLYWRLREHGRLHNLDQVLADYRVHDGSVSSASLRNGRLMAVSSQLAALSARRRAAGAADLVFDAPRAAWLRRCSTLQEMLDTVGADLTETERSALPLAASAKLLELASYQPFELETSDCRLFHRAHALAGQDIASPANRKALVGLASRAALRLWDAGRRRDAAALLRAGDWPPFLGRYALRRVIPAALRRRLHGALRQVRSA